MQEMTKQAIKKLLSDTSRVLRVEDFEDIAELDKLACQVIKQTPDEKRLLDQPFVLCGEKFYPLTIAKSLWYAEKCEEWGLAGIVQDCFLFWLLTVPLNDEALDQYADRKEADKAVRRLSRRLHCKPSEMTEVFQKCVGTQGKDANGSEPVNYGGLIAVLIREYGGTPNLWLYEVPVEKIGAMVEHYVARINAEHEASAKASSHKGKAVAPKATAKLEALKNFREKCNAIKAKWGTNG